MMTTSDKSDKRIEKKKETTVRRTKALNEYLSQHGFQSDGVWYFRGTWLNQQIKDQFESDGIIEYVGTRSDLEKAGVEVPGYGPYQAVFYKFDPRTLRVQ